MGDNIFKNIIDNAFDHTINELNKTIGFRIFNLRTGLNMSRADLGKKVGMHETTIKKYEDGLIKSVGTDKVELFAKALDSTVEHLMGWDEETLTSNEIQNRRDIRYTKEIPILGRISAGVPLLATEHIEGYEKVEDSSLDYALIVKGDSMIGARIYEGDVVYVTKDCDYLNGDIVIALINGDDATIKRYYRYGDKIILKPENPKMKELEYEAWEVLLLGKVKSAKIMF